MIYNTPEIMHSYLLRYYKIHSVALISWSDFLSKVVDRSQTSTNLLSKCDRKQFYFICNRIFHEICISFKSRKKNQTIFLYFCFRLQYFYKSIEVIHL